MRQHPSRTACLAVAFAALVAGSRAARAGEVDALAPPAEADAPAGEAEASAPSAEVEAPGAPTEFYAPAPPAQVYVPAKPETPRITWYGWQTLIADGAAVGLLWLALVSSDGSAGNILGTASFMTYLLGGPIVHWAHGHGGKGWASVGLRVGLPIGGAIAGALIGRAACGSEGEGDFVPCPVVYGALGLVGGMAAAPIVDATVIAREPVAAPAGPPLQALFVPSGDGGKLVVAGRF